MFIWNIEHLYDSWFSYISAKSADSAVFFSYSNPQAMFIVITGFEAKFC